VVYLTVTSVRYTGTAAPFMHRLTPTACRSKKPRGADGVRVSRRPLYAIPVHIGPRFPVKVGRALGRVYYDVCRFYVFIFFSVNDDFAFLSD